MFWFQAGCAFVLWVFAGAGLARSGERLLAKASQVSAPVRVPAALALLLLAVAILFAGLTAIQSGLTGGSESMPISVWAAVVAIGLVFVVLQAGALALLYLGVTQASSQASAVSDLSSHE